MKIIEPSLPSLPLGALSLFYTRTDAPSLCIAQFINSRMGNPVKNSLSWNVNQNAPTRNRVLHARGQYHFANDFYVKSQTYISQWLKILQKSLIFSFASEVTYFDFYNENGKKLNKTKKWLDGVFETCFRFCRFSAIFLR